MNWDIPFPCDESITRNTQSGCVLFHEAAKNTPPPLPYQASLHRLVEEHCCSFHVTTQAAHCTSLPATASRDRSA
jgi:hypothetical protein